MEIRPHYRIAREICTCVLIATGLAFNTIQLSAQISPGQTWFGGFFSFGFDFQRSDFAKIPGIPTCCPTSYNSGNGSGFNAGGFGLFPLSDGQSIGLKAGLRFAQGSVFGEQVRPIDNQQSMPVDATIIHSVEIHTTALTLHPWYEQNLWGELGGAVGLMLEFPLLNSYQTSEQIESPPGTTYIDGGKSRLNYIGNKGIFSDFIPRLTLALGYPLPINARETILLRPEITFEMGIGSTIKDVSLYSDRIALGFSLRTRVARTVRRNILPIVPLEKPNVKESKPVVAKEPVAPVKPVDTLLCDMTSELIGDGNSPASGSVIPIKSVAARNGYPLLTFVFFDHNSSEIPARYQLLNAKQLETFRLSDLDGKDFLSIYYHVLDIIGTRLTANPKLSVTLTGCTSNLDEEKVTEELGKRRAESLKKYLVSIWGIEPKRIATVGRSLPIDPTDTKSIEGAEENRRVEISSEDWEIVEPFYINDTLFTSKVQRVVFRPSVSSTKRIVRWDCVVSQGEKNFVTFSGTGEVPKSFGWDLSKGGRTLPQKSGPIVCTLTIRDESGKTSKCSLLNLSSELNEERDVRVDIFSLVLFNFNKSQLSESHKRVISQIRKRILVESQVQVTGYADKKTGSQAYNSSLALRRAQEVSGELKFENVQVGANVTDDDLFPTDTPEGRFHCRTVRIAVENTKK